MGYKVPYAGTAIVPAGRVAAWNRDQSGFKRTIRGASDAVRAPFARRADAVQIVGIVAVRLESGRLPEVAEVAVQGLGFVSN